MGTVVELPAANQKGVFVTNAILDICSYLEKYIVLFLLVTV